MNEIDYLVFEHVYKNEKGYVDYLKEEDGGGIIKPYSTDERYAFEIVKKVNLTITPGWRVFKANTGGSMRDIKYIGTTNNQTWTEHRSLSMAVCLAALKEYGITNLEDKAEEIILAIEEERKRKIKEMEQLLGWKYWNGDLNV